MSEQTRKVLVVDDDPLMRDLICEVLNSGCFEAMSASNATEGLALAQLHKDLSLVLTDLEMPGVSGLEFTRALRAQDPNLPIIILSGSQELPTAIEAMKAGANDYVVKGEDIQDSLFEAIDKALARDLRVLLVDDDAFVRDFVSEVLSTRGFEVISASDGTEAIAKALTDPTIRLVVSDMDMPGLSGLELTHRLREERPDLPIIILTGNQQLSTAIEAMKAGASDYVVKGEDIQEGITFSIRRVLEQQRLKGLSRKLGRELEAISLELARKNQKLEAFNQTLVHTVKRLTRIGSALISEHDPSALLGIIVAEAFDATNAEGANLYINEKGSLRHMISRHKGRQQEQQVLLSAPIALDAQHFAAMCASSRKIMEFRDVASHDNTEAPCEAFAQHAGYKPQSLLVLPLLDRQETVVGVLELANATDPISGTVTYFPEDKVEIAFSLACQAAVSIDNARGYETIQIKKQAFERFVPIEFLNFLGKREVEEIRIGDVTTEELSVLFSDIRNFTAMSEQLTPEENFKFLNNYLNFIGPVIAKNGGFIDKYIGDAIMALFDGKRSGVADDAVQAAIEMNQTVGLYNSYRKKKGYKPIAIGIGVNTGYLTLGMLGFEKRIDSTVIGDTVNVASRMEGLTKLYGVGTIITEDTYFRLKHPERFLVRELDVVKVKGKEQALAVFEVFNTDAEATRDAKLAGLGKYRDAVELYRAARWADALAAFAELKSILPNDPVVERYRLCSERYALHPPEDGKAAITKLEEK